jgi:hypothetical protein
MPTKRCPDGFVGSCRWIEPSLFTTIGTPFDLRSHAGAFGFADTDGKAATGRTE